MKAQTLLTKAAAGLGTVALAITMGGCAHHSVLDTTAQNTGEIRTEKAATNDATSGNTLGTAPAPSNAQGVSGTTTTTPAVISGPAAVDNTGRVYTSSSVGSAGNGSATGLNTNVNIIPKTQKSTVTVTESMPAPTPVVTETTTTTTQTAEVTPAPAPVYTPAPTVESTPAPMTSSTTETTNTSTDTTTTTTTHHRRMRKD